MKKEIVALALALCLLLGCFGCQSEQKDIYDQFAGSETSQEESQAEESAAPEEETQEDALSGELTISVKFPTSESSGLGMVAAEFAEQHPGVTVTIQPGLTMEEAYSGDTALFQAAEKSYTEALAVELTSGAGADLIDVGSLSFNRYAESGALCDLYTLCDWEETFPEEEYFRGIMDAPATQGKLYALVVTANPSACWLNRPVASLLGAEGLEELTASKLVELYGQAVSQGLVEESFVTDEEMVAATFVKNQFPDLLDLEGETAAFDTPEFVTLLEGLHTLQFTRTVEEGELYQSTTGSYPVLDNTTRLVASAALSQGELMGYLTGQIDGILLPEATEQGSRLFTGSLYAVNSGSQQQELAWEFLKFWVSWQDADSAEDSSFYDRYGGEYPVNRAIAQQKLQVELGKLYEEELAEKVLDLLDSADALNQFDPLLYQNFQPILADYFDRGLTDAATCATQLQERADLYLKE